MAQHCILEAKTRGNEKPNAVRSAGETPIVLYGRGEAATHLRVPSNVVKALYKKAGMSTLIDCAIDGAAPVTALIHAVQRDPITDVITHIDLQIVDMTKPMEVTVPLVLSGIAPAVKEHGGMLLRQMNEVTIRCLPEALVHEVTVDLAVLTSLGAMLHASDIPLPPGVTLAGDAHRVVVSVKAPRVEKETEAGADTVGDVAKVEVEKKGKEEAAAAEGADTKKGDKKEGKKEEKKK